MRDWINWGTTATGYGIGNPREEFAEAVVVYFLEDRDEDREWTDDWSAGFRRAQRDFGATGPDQLMLDANTQQPSATGTIQVQDRYDFLQLQFTGTWK